MKKWWIILMCVLLTGCWKTEVDMPELTPGRFHDECSVGDSIFYFMNCVVGYEGAELQFVKKKVQTQTIEHYIVLGRDYAVKKDTVEVLLEQCFYPPRDFKRMLENKNTLPRDTTIFHITPNMCCHWSVFDEMYIKYVK